MSKGGDRAKNRHTSERRREAVKGRSDALASFDHGKIRELLLHRSLNAVRTATGISHRQLRRLRDGELLRTHRIVIETLAEHFGVDLETLLAERRGHNHSPGEFASETLAKEVAVSWWRALGNKGEIPLHVSTSLEKLLSFDFWTEAIYKTGSPLFQTDSGVTTFRPRRPAIRRLENRRIRFARSMETAMSILLEPCNNKGKSKALLSSRRVGVFAGCVLRKGTSLADHGHARANPAGRREVAEWMAGFVNRIETRRRKGTLIPTAELLSS